jgi:hypothetical protein
MLGLKVFKFEYLSNTKLSENCRFGFQHQQVQYCYQVLKFHDKVCEVALWHREGIVKHIFIFSNNIYHIFENCIYTAVKMSNTVSHEPC